MNIEKFTNATVFLVLILSIFCYVTCILSLFVVTEKLNDLSLKVETVQTELDTYFEEYEQKVYQ